MRTTAIALSVAMALGLTACGQQDDASKQASSTAASPATSQSDSAKTDAQSQQTLTSGIDKSGFDTSVSYGEDFFNAVNGNWVKTTKIPEDKSDYGSFGVLQDQAIEAVHSIMKKAAEQNKPADSELGKIGNFYKSFMAKDAVEQKGATPIQPELQQISAISSYPELADAMGELTLDGVDVPFSFYVSVDAKKSDQYAVSIWQSGLGLPDRSYYTDASDSHKKLLAGYQQYLQQVFKLAGVADPEQAAANAVEVESWLAKHQWSRVDSRDSDKTYNKKSAAEIKQLLGDFSWAKYATAAGLANVDHIIIAQPSYLQEFGEGIKNISLDKWQDYLRAQLFNDYSQYLSSDFVDAHFNFFGKTLRGVEQQSPRWKRAVKTGNSVIGQLIGKYYVKDNFKPESKERMVELVDNLLKAYESSIKSLQWMSEDTKAKALEKLHKFTPKIGYPSKWKSYDELALADDDLVGNLKASAHFEYKKMLDKLGQPVDRTEWHMTPQTVNAYYNPPMNEIVFPAAILQPPFFNPKAEDAVNYGGIGAVIGHEIGHGFDDQGSKYDGDGNMNNWWTDKDLKEFQKRTGELVAQYNAYAPFKDAHVNGQLTLGENIGDLGGMTIAYKAYHMSLGDKKSPVIDGLTGDQRFFMGWAQVWRRKYRDAELRNRLVTDPHSPAHYRVNGVVPNVPAFYSAFDIKPDDPMYIPPEKRVKIW